MSRSPLSYPLNRGADIDGGGVADLQTDVMRFMAILCLCLVAIFALVQSVPVSAPTLPAPLPPADQPIVTAAPQASAREPAPKSPEPARILPLRTVTPPVPDVIPPTPPVRNVRAPETRPSSATARAVTVPPSPPEDGFTLRFESDRSLKALVAREEIGLYAIGGGSAMRLAIDRGRLQFWQASLPSRFHEMDGATVPADVALALARSGFPETTRWGVTLPPGLSRQLDRYLENHSGGELIIAADGSMRRE